MSVVNGEQAKIQKCLLLLNLKELYATFKELNLKVLIDLFYFIIISKHIY